MLKVVHFCAGLEQWNGMANTARQFVDEERAKGDDSQLTNNVDAITDDIDQVVIHGAWLPVLWKVAKRAKSIGAKLLIRPAGSYDPVRLAYHGLKKLLVAPFERRMLRRADVLLATCEAEVDWIKSYEPKVNSIELADLKRFFNLTNLNPVNPVNPVKKDLHLLYLGRRHPLKGLEFLEEAFGEYENLKVWKYGSMEIHNEDKSGIIFRVESNVFEEEKEKVWDWCDVLILPTLSDNFGLVIAEAPERGKRVITTDGAPAWGDGNDYGGRLIYLKGYRDGTPEERVRLLKKAIEELSCLF